MTASLPAVPGLPGDAACTRDGPRLTAGTVVPDALAYPLIAGALSVLALVQGRLCSLRSTRDLDITIGGEQQPVARSYEFPTRVVPP